jgi:putative membrane protein
MEYYNYLKSLHLIFVITWFAGLYIVRLFVFKSNDRQTIMKKFYKAVQNNDHNHWYIITYSTVLASFFAFGCCSLPNGENGYKCHGCMLNLALFCTVFIPCKCHKSIINCKRREYGTNFLMRLWNEGATLFFFLSYSWLF